MFPSALTCLALVIYHEARGEPLPAQYAVAEATIRRAEDPRWPDTVCKVVFQPGQYKWARNKPPITEMDAWRKSFAIAEIVAKNHVGAATRCSDHFHDDSELPGWTAKMDLEVKVGRMMFYCSNPEDWRRPK